MLPKPKSITDEGGLKAHLTAENIDYELFVKLDDSKLSNSAIGKVLHKGRDTIRRWRIRRREEQAKLAE